MTDKIKKLPVVHRRRDQAIELVHYDPKQPCQHKLVTYRIREGETEVECGGCGTRLDPMFVLRQMAIQDSIWRQRQETSAKIAREVEQRRRTTCQHCGKMTKIRNL